MKHIDLFTELVGECYQPECDEGNMALVFKTSSDLCREFGEFVTVDLIDVGTAMRKLGYRFVTVDGKHYWRLFSKDVEEDGVP